MIDHLQFIPKMYGEVLYPGGTPMQPNHLSLEGKNYQDIYFQEVYSEMDLQVLGEYLAYYLHAPCWQVDDTMKEVRKKALEIKTAEDLNTCLWDCLDIGIDPFVSIL